MGKLIRSKDWSKTPLGSPDTWPQSLRTAISICIASNFPICISWGLHRVQIYNDGYWPITGDMHPVSVGQDFKDCWISAWPVIGQAFEEASLGATRFLENQRIFLDRYGYTEETFFTFSFSPILDESGGVGGLFHPVIEQTQQTLSERRLNILPAVAQHTLTAKTTKEASTSILDCLKDFELDIPFALLYSITDNGKEAMIEGSVGLESNSPLAPAKINLEEHALKSWHLAEAVQTGKSVLVENLTSIFGIFHSGPYPEPPTQALIFPVTLPGIESNNYFFVVGISARRRLDAKCLLFYELLTASVTSVLTKSKTYEQEREKAEALAEIDRAKTVFFSNISHEFRTPLTLMLSPLEELLNQKNNNFSESENQNIQTTHRNAMRLLKLVNTLLDFSRIESGRQQAVFSLADIVALTKNLAANFRSVIEKAGLKLIVRADTIMQPVYVDRQMWEKIVFNLLSNAFKYTLEGSITVEISAEKDSAVLQVKDTGIGIPENELPKMFERFHRVQNVTGRTYEGTGIGLSLIKELVQMHKGSISVESELNEGSVFTVKIPFGKEHLDENHISTTAMDADEIAATIYVDEIETLIEPNSSQKSIPVSPTEKTALPVVLVVDDNADMRQHIRSVLSTNFNVITANNGMDAFDKLKETTPALVLSDVMMPVMDGIGLLKEMKGNRATANIPVILLTARAGEESKIEGWETGADDYLIKPFSAKELLARVQAQIKIVKLRQSLEGKVRNLFMEAPAIICVLRGPQHVFELANEVYLTLIGKRDVLGKTVLEVMPELKGQGYIELLDNVYATGEPYIGNETPSQIDRGNGKLEEAYFNFVYQPTHNSEGDIDGVLLCGIEVTEQVLARNKIEESEQQFSTLANNIQNLAWIADGDGQIFWYNQRWYDYTGTNLEEMKGWGWQKVHHPDHVERVVDFVKKAWKINEPFELTFPLRGADGKYRRFLTRVFPVTDAEGKILRWVGTNTDIEKEKTFSEHLEEKVNQRTGQLSEANQSLEEKNTELQKMNKELEAFTYISSHDLQEPLRKIQTFAGRIIATEKEQLSDTAKDYFRRMNDAATRMQTLIQDLLVFSRVNTSERKFEITDLAKIIDEVKEDFRETMEEKNATITTGEMCEAHIIPFQVRQLMHNLIGNALKFSRKDIRPVISIESKKVSAANSPLNKPACHISVSDNGIGFGKEYSEKIFEVFQRLHSKEEYAGTGIGLAIVKKIVDNHHGIITAESEFGKGATFNIYIPA